jgi:hypothetical protein
MDHSLRNLLSGSKEVSLIYLFQNYADIQVMPHVQIRASAAISRHILRVGIQYPMPISA